MTRKELNLKDEEVIKRFASLVEGIIKFSPYEELVNDLKELKSIVEYLNVSPRQDIYEIDLQIEVLLLEFKKLLIQNELLVDVANQKIKEIMLLLYDRKSRY